MSPSELDQASAKPVSKVFFTVVVPAPDEPVTEMIGWRCDMISLP